MNYSTYCWNKYRFFNTALKGENSIERDPTVVEWLNLLPETPSLLYRHQFDPWLLHFQSTSVLLLLQSQWSIVPVLRPLKSIRRTFMESLYNDVPVMAALWGVNQRVKIICLSHLFLLIPSSNYINLFFETSVKKSNGCKNIPVLPFSQVSNRIRTSCSDLSIHHGKFYHTHRCPVTIPLSCQGLAASLSSHGGERTWKKAICIVHSYPS